MTLADMPFCYDPVEVRAFYSALQVLGKSPNFNYAILLVVDNPHLITAQLIATLPGVPTGEGLCDLQKKSPPTGPFDIRKRLPKPSATRTLKNKQLNFCDKLLHYLLVCNVTSRKEGRDTVTFCDQALMGHVLAGDTIDTPRVILRHMMIAKKGKTHELPYPLLVKRIMEHFGLYRLVREVSAEKLISVVGLRRLAHYHTMEDIPQPHSPSRTPAKDTRAQTVHPSPSPEPSTSRQPPASSRSEERRVGKECRL